MSEPEKYVLEDCLIHLAQCGHPWSFKLYIHYDSILVRKIRMYVHVGGKMRGNHTKPLVIIFG